MLELARELQEATEMPLVIQSNAEIVYPEPPQYAANRLVEFTEIGVNMVGGCCGTGRDHIRKLAFRLRT